MKTIKIFLLMLLSSFTLSPFLYSKVNWGLLRQSSDRQLKRRLPYAQRKNLKEEIAAINQILQERKMRAMGPSQLALALQGIENEDIIKDIVENVLVGKDRVYLQNLQTRLQGSPGTLFALNQATTALEAENTTKELQKTAEQLKQTQNEYDDILARYNELLKKYEQLSGKSELDQKSLRELQATIKELQALNQKLKDLKSLLDGENKKLFDALKDFVISLTLLSTFCNPPGVFVITSCNRKNFPSVVLTIAPTLVKLPDTCGNCLATTVLALPTFFNCFENC